MLDTLKTAVVVKIKAKPDRKAKVTIYAKGKKIMKTQEVQLPHTFSTCRRLQRDTHTGLPHE